MALFGRSKPEPAPAEAAAQPSPAPAPQPTADVVRSVDEHRSVLLSAVSSLRPFGIGLLDAAGLTLCESIESDIDLPVYTAARTEGFAVRGSNLVGASPHRPVRLPVVGEIDAGGFRGAPLMPGTAVKVAAGAPVPEGADAVVPLSETTEVGDEVEFRAEAVFQQELALAGSRISDGDLLLGNGSVLDPRAIGLLAEVGIDKVLARPKPRVVVASLGADLVDPGLPLERLHHRYDSGTPLIAAAARADGAQVFPIGILSSDPTQLRRTLTDQLLRADLLLLSADVTPDLVEVLSGLGAVDDARVAAVPAGPSLVATMGEERVPVVVLPRDTVDAYIGYQVFVRPLVRKLAGLAPAEREAVTAPLARPVTSHAEATSFLLGRAGEHGVEPLATADTATVLELVAADTLMVIEPGLGEVAAGTTVTCWPLRS